MKNLLSIFALLLFCASCEKKEADSSIHSEWKLIEILADPGDGSGVFEAVSSDRTLTLFDDGTYSSVGRICDMDKDATEIESDILSLNNSYLSSSNCSGNQVTYSIDGDELTYSIPCDEPCAMKYKRID